MGVKTFAYSPTKHVKYVSARNLEPKGIYVWECPLCTMCHMHEDYYVTRGFAESHWQRSDHGRWELWE